MKMPSPKEIDENFKVLRNWYRGIKSYYQNHKWPRIILITLNVITILIVISGIYFFFQGYIVYQSTQDKVEMNPLEESYFYIKEKGIGFQLNNTYEFEWTITPLVSSRAKVIFYFKPEEVNKRTPTTSGYSDKDLKEGESMTIKGSFDTESSDVGKFTLCGELTHKKTLNIIDTACHTTSIRITE